MTSWISRFLSKVQGVGAAFGKLANAGDFQARLFQDSGRAGGGDDLKAQVGELPGDGGDFAFVGVADADEDAAAQGQGRVGGHLGFGVGDAEVGVQAHDFARGTHFRGEQDVLAEKAVEGENGFLDGPVMGQISRVKPRSARFLPAMTLAASLASGTPMALLTKGTVREARGLTSRT